MTLTLRKKTLLVVTLTLVILIIALYFVTRAVVLGSFEELEEDNVGLHVERVNAAIANELDKMELTLNDWAKPGQTLDYDRLAGLLTDEIRKPSEQSSNKLAELMANLNVNVFLFARSDGQQHWGWAYDEKTGKLTAPPASIKSQLGNPQSPLLGQPAVDNTLGGLLLPAGEDPMLVVSARTTYQLGEGGGGVEKGTMIMGRYLDDDEVARLASQTKLQVDISAVDEVDPELVPSEGTPVLVKVLSDDEVAGYTLLSDIRESPDRGRVLAVTVPRKVMEEGRASIVALLISVVVVGVALVILIAFLLNRLVLSRLARLDSEVGEIGGGSEDLSQRVMVQGNDELSRLGTSINGMLGDIQVERQKSEDLLLNVLPVPIANRLKAGESTIADSFSGVSVLFSDVVGFTKLATTVSATELVNMLNGVFSGFDTLTDKHGLEKIKTIGDAYMVVSGLPDPREDHAEAMAEMALEMYEELDKLNKEHGTNLEIRVGINSGPVVAGIIGTRKFAYDLWGDTVNTAARMESHGVEGRIHLTQETYVFLKDKYDFDDRGFMDIKGKGDMHTYLLKGRKAAVGQQPAATTSDDGEE